MIPLALFTKISHDKEFIEKTIAAFNIVAHEILREDADYPNHILRVNHANMVIQQNPENTKNFVTGVVGSKTIQDSEIDSVEGITDEMVIRAVYEIWDSLIGIRPDTNMSFGPLPPTTRPVNP